MSLRSSPVLAVVLGFLMALVAVPGTGATEGRLIRSALAAAGEIDPIELTLNERAVQRELDRIVSRIGEGKPGWRRALKIHRILQRDVLLRYRDDADGLMDVFESGDYNCLSATLLYGLVAQRLGFRAEVLEYPGHLLVRLHGRGQPIDIETTSRRGFDRGGDPRPIRSERTAAAVELRRLDAMLAPSPHRGSGEPAYWELPLDAAVGFTWLNTAWRAMEQGRSVEASRAAVAAWTRLPGLSDRGNGVERLLSVAFREEYEAGRFERAYRIAAIDVEVHPDRTTSRDRLLAAALKRIEQDCERDDPVGASALLAGTRARLGDGADVRRLERHAWPVVAACAVRLERWWLAERAADRYAAVEPDPVEAERLMTWVGRRAGGAQELPTDPELPYRPR